MNNEQYVRSLEAKITELESIISTFVEDNADGKTWKIRNKKTGFFIAEKLNGLKLEKRILELDQLRTL